MSLVPSSAGSLLPSTTIADLAAAAHLASQALSPATTAAYEADWRRFVAYSGGTDLAALAYVDLVALIAAHLGRLAESGAKASTLGRAAAGVRWGLGELGRTDEPTRDRAVRDVLRGARRDSTRRARGARAIGVGDVARIVATCDDSVRGVRDRALILAAFAGAFRRSELVGLDLANVSDDGQRITLLIERSKTDQEGKGRFVVLHPGTGLTCPVAALRAWIVVRGGEPGPLFVSINKAGALGGRLSAEGFRLVLSAASRAAGVEDVQPHGLRAGHVTEARRHGATAAQVRQVTGHADERMISHYTRALDAADNSGRYLGL